MGCTKLTYFTQISNLKIVRNDSKLFANRTCKKNAEAYPYGFGGHERDDEAKGSGNHLAFGDYGYDTRLGRRWNTDPVVKPWESGYATFRNNPLIYADPDGRDGILIVFPDYKIDPELKVTIWGKNFKAPKVPLGHAGVLLIDNKTGETKYYEFGRYNTTDGTRGRVRSSATDGKPLQVSNVIIDPKTNKPTQESLNKVLGQLSKQVGHSGRIQGAYVEGDFDKMNDYAEGKVKESNSIYNEYNKNRESYSLSGNNCATFGCDVLNQDSQAAEKSPWIFNPTPDNTADEYQDNFPEVNYDPKTKTTSSEIYE